MFQGNKLVPFIKITVAIQRLIAPTKRLLEGGHVGIPGVTPPPNGYKAFEANIDFEIRYHFDITQRMMIVKLVLSNFHS